MAPDDPPLLADGADASAKRSGRSLLVLACLTAGALLVVFVTARAARPEFAELPQVEEVRSILVSLPDAEGFGEGVPEFTVPEEHVAAVLTAFRPARLYEYPADWDRLALGRLTIRTKSGRDHALTFRWPGKNPVCFTLDGSRCVRGGRYEPVYVAEEEAHSQWTDEAMLIRAVLRAISHEVRTGEQSSGLPSMLIQLERSRGERPPARWQDNSNA